ncbi:MAG: GntR family transcriptional regulator [Bacteroidales bacterium]|nr:GntR family transcriptional regulator [Bacteroidales bacterium]
MELNRKSTTPLHAQAEQVLRRLIESDEYKSGKLLPKEVELSKQLHISRNTLRQATARLVNEGLLERKKGVGTKVARKGISVGVKNWLSFSQEMKMLGIEVKNFDLHLYFQRPSPEIADFFGSDPDIKCLVLERLRGNKEYPFVFFVSYFNPALPLTGEEDYVKPLYEMLERDCGIIVKTSKEEISARLAGDYMAKMLEISPNDAILIRKRFVFDEHGVPVEYNIGYYRSDSFTYSIEATR